MRIMLLHRLLCLSLIGVLPLSAADEAKNPEIVMPVVKVVSSRIERFGLLNQKLLDRDGEVAWRLVIWHVPTQSDTFSLFVGGAQVGDEIVSIDGRDVAAIPKNERRELLRGQFKIVIKRPIGRRSFKLLELDGRGA